MSEAIEIATAVFAYPIFTSHVSDVLRFFLARFRRLWFEIVVDDEGTITSNTY